MVLLSLWNSRRHGSDERRSDGGIESTLQKLWRSLPSLAASWPETGRSSGRAAPKEMVEAVVEVKRRQMLLDHTNCVCTQCTQEAVVLVFNEKPTESSAIHLSKSDSRCWDHYTKDIMDLPFVNEERA